jgi:hypothetical protein
MTDNNELRELRHNLLPTYYHSYPIKKSIEQRTTNIPPSIHQYRVQRINDNGVSNHDEKYSWHLAEREMQVVQTITSCLFFLLFFVSQSSLDIFH